jgi:hypothetical protein
MGSFSVKKRRLKNCGESRERDGNEPLSGFYETAV